MCEEARKEQEKKGVSLTKKKRNLFLGGALLLGLTDLVVQIWLLSRGLSSKNQGFGWGLPFSLGWQGELRWLLIGAGVLGLIGMGYWYKLSVRSGERQGLLMVMTGGVVNLIMRLIWGEVVDYLCVAGLCFNLADILITGGVLLVIKDTWKEKWRK